MLIPLLLLVVLVILISRKSSQLETSAGGPMAAASGLWILFWAVTRGAVQVRADEMFEGLLMGLLIYAAAFVVIYFAMFVWLKAKSPRWPEKKVSPPPAVGAFRKFLGVHGKAIDWRYAAVFFLGLMATQVVDLIFYPHIKPWYALGSNVLFVLILVLGFYFIGCIHVGWTALTIGVVVGSAGVLTALISGLSLSPLTFLTSMLFTLVFIVATIWLAKRLRQFWVALGPGYFLAGLATMLTVAVYESVRMTDSSVAKSILLNPKGYLVLALESLVLVFVTFVFQLILISKKQPLNQKTKESIVSLAVNASDKDLRELVNLLYKAAISSDTEMIEEIQAALREYVSKERFIQTVNGLSRDKQVTIQNAINRTRESRLEPTQETQDRKKKCVFCNVHFFEPRSSMDKLNDQGMQKVRVGCSKCGTPVCFSCAADKANRLGKSFNLFCPKCGAELGKGGEAGHLGGHFKGWD